MPTPGWCMRALSLLAAYLRQRTRLALLAPLSIVLALASCLFVAPWSASVRAVVIAALEALGLILAFRIWDDVEDRESDRVRHPDRVLVSASTTAPFQLLAFALALTSLLPLTTLAFAFRRLAAIGLATAMLAVWYGARSTDNRRHALGEHILATKYPLIAYTVTPVLPASAVTPRLVAILLVVYALICACAYADDVELRHIFTSRRSNA
jgi:4-hydroxybenzoate polyprenyltransferase